MRSLRAIIAGLGATGLLQAVACVLVLGGALMAFHGSPGRRGLGEGGAAVRVTHRGGRALRRLVVAVGPAAPGPRSSRADAGSGGAPGRRSPTGANGASPSRSPRAPGRVPEGERPSPRRRALLPPPFELDSRAR